MEIVVVGLLILLNGLLSMSEFAVVSARGARLRRRVNAGNRGAAVALKLSRRPDRFLSTVQIGITLVGILAGAFGGAAIAEDLAVVLRRISWLASRADSVSLFLVVGATTYLTLVLGELVPKRIAIRNPEGVASKIAPLMLGLSIITYPFVWLLSTSTRLVLRLLGQGDQAAPQVSEEEVRSMVHHGAELGVFARSEARMVSGVFLLDDLRADAIMTPRMDVVWIDVRAGREHIAKIMHEHAHSHFPVCDGEPDNVVRVVSARSLAAALLSGDELDLRRIGTEPKFVPDSYTAAQLLGRIRTADTGFLVVIGEHGGLDGIVTTFDLAEAVFGDLVQPGIRRTVPGSYVIDASIPVEELEALFGEGGPALSGGRRYATVAGLVLHALGHIPEVGTDVVVGRLRLRVSRMRGHRIEEVEATLVAGEEA